MTTVKHFLYCRFGQPTIILKGAIMAQTYKARCKAYRAHRARRAAKMEARRAKPAVITALMNENVENGYPRTGTRTTGWTIDNFGHPVRA